MVWAPALCLVGIFGCASTLKVDVGWDQNAPFPKYKTWAWKLDGSIQDAIWARRFESVLSDQLAQEGLTEVSLEQSPDLWAVAHVRFSAETRVVSYDPMWGYGYGAWAPMNTMIYEVPLGSVVLDLVDVRLKRVVWQGTASDVIAAGKSNEEREQKLISILAQWFATYPATAGAKPAA
jgi:hypothetical protein